MNSMEEWRDIKEYEGIYQVSSYGRVKRLKGFFHNNHILRATKRPDGYLVVTLCKGNIHKSCRVHRLVADAFIPNPNNYPIINHKDEIRDNDMVDNLEWCDKRYNAMYNDCCSTNITCRKKVLQLSKEGIIIGRFNSITEAQNITGVNLTSISKVALGKEHCKSAGGYIWCYAK